MTNQRLAIAERIKGLRDASDLAPGAVAEATGVAAEEYARYEAGEADAPMSFLSVLAAFYKVDVTAVLTGGDAHATAFHVTRRGTGPVIERRHVYHYEALGALFAGKVMEPFIVTVEPALKEKHLNTHPGQEFNYVLAGTLLLTVGENTLTLEPGDSIYFNAAVPHGMRAGGAAPATFLAVITA
ncbi:MAG: XRE family transcriptional regulator [Verrucomicrobiota bacterium]|jgi:mannose-6-phosphate isomerase-like protein (cupin superfamily)|nr:XRE family transcriptional regulator [Verrucomicrobiota bacterium]